MSEHNPFSQAYLTEASLTTDDLLERYSFLPFLHVQTQLSSTTNAFLVGRKGVGKTMILRVFEPEFQRLIYKSDQAEHRKIRERLPQGTLGLYLNLASPGARLTLFQGHGFDERWWLRAYSDFLNTVLLEMAFEALDSMLAVPEWLEANRGKGGDSLEAVAPGLLERLRNESSEYDRIASVPALRNHLRSRIQHWSRYVNRDPSTPQPPAVPLALGVPLFALVSSVRAAKMLRKPFRVFLLVDQYESLYQHRNVIDFRPAFNQAMYEASRGGTGVEFKIGTRQYSYRNLNLLEKGGRIESGREMIEIPLDDLANRFYHKFAIELFSKRLTSVAGHLRQPTTVLRPYECLPSLTPTEEARRYVGESTSDLPKHLSVFSQHWESYGVNHSELNDALSDAHVREAEPLIATLACIAVTRWLRDGTRAPVGFGLVRKSAGRVGLRDGLTQSVEHIAERYALGSAAARKRSAALRAIDDFVRDVEHAALFHLASAYKNQRKYYAGLDSIIRLSSNVAVVLIEILRAAYDQHILDGGSVFGEPVKIEVQSEAIYRVSESWFNRVPSECDFGETLQQLIRGWGVSFRKLQLEATVPQPCPNGFSFKGDVLSSGLDEACTPRNDARVLLSEAVNWGLLEEHEHQDKRRGQPKRRKLYLNRVFCPYFGVSEIRRKDPIYVRALEAFTADVLRGDTPDEVKSLINKGTRLHNGKQSPLFA
jgi:hypothetical protein